MEVIEANGTLIYTHEMLSLVDCYVVVSLATSIFLTAISLTFLVFLSLTAFLLLLFTLVHYIRMMLIWIRKHDIKPMTLSIRSVTKIMVFFFFFSIEIFACTHLR